VAAIYVPITTESNSLAAHECTLCLKKFPPFYKLFVHVTSSNLNRIIYFFALLESVICYKPIRHHSPQIRHVATLPWQSKKSNFCRYLSGMEEKANKVHFKCTDFNSFVRVAVYAECIYVLTEYLKY